MNSINVLGKCVFRKNIHGSGKILWGSDNIPAEYILQK